MKLPYGVVLMGGRSTRMGTDKSMIQLDNRYLYEIAIEKLLPFCAHIRLSINENQSNLNHTFPTIIDKYENTGPIGGILSCFENDIHPMLLLAPDLVNISVDTVKDLIGIHQKNNQSCSMYYDSDQQIYEPMLSIWEKSALLQLQTFYMNDGRSLQKFLNTINAPRHTLYNTEEFVNINTVQEKEAWLQKR